MGVLGVSHIAVGVTDLDRALQFYCDVIGLAVTADWIQEFDDFTNDQKVRRRTAFLRFSDDEYSSALALDQLMTPEPADARAELFDLGTHHFSFWVDDIDGVIARAQSGGFAVIYPHTADTRDYGEAPGGKIRSVFMRDPDNNFVQVDQREPTHTPASHEDVSSKNKGES